MFSSSDQFIWVTIPIGRETWLRTMTVWVRLPGGPPVYNCNNISSHNPTCKIQGQWRSGTTPLYALVAQLAEALGLGPRGWGFESLAAHHFVGLFHALAYAKEYAPPCRKVRLELIQMVAKNSLILLQANGLNHLATDQALRVRILLGVPISLDSGFVVTIEPEVKITTYGTLVQLAEASDSNSECSGFESQESYHLPVDTLGKTSQARTNESSGCKRKMCGLM